MIKKELFKDKMDILKKELNSKVMELGLVDNINLIILESKNIIKSLHIRLTYENIIKIMSKSNSLSLYLNKEINITEKKTLLEIKRIIIKITILLNSVKNIENILSFAILANIDRYITNLIINGGKENEKIYFSVCGIQERRKYEIERS